MIGGSPGGVGGAGGQAGGTVTPGKRRRQYLLFFLTGASGLVTIKAVAGALEPESFEPKSLRTMRFKRFPEKHGVWSDLASQRPPKTIALSAIFSKRPLKTLVPGQPEGFKPFSGRLVPEVPKA